MSTAQKVPIPSEAVALRLARIATLAKELMAVDPASAPEPVGVIRRKNDRRRTAESIMVLLADTEVTAYLAALKAP